MIDRELWHRLTPREKLPGLPCPSCASGKLKLVSNGLVLKEPKYSSDHHKSGDDWEFDHTVTRWSATLGCDEEVCREIVFMIGDTEWVEAEVELPDGQFHHGVEEMLRIQAVFPPPLFRISEQVPSKVRKQLEIAFRTYWTDGAACVARLRTAVEALLDQQKVPKEHKDKKGKLRRMNLEQRIDAFTSGASHQDQLQGLRNIGNLGTHGGDDVDDGDLFDAIDVLEFALIGIYDTQTIKAKAQKLAAKKAKS
jgi:hypothetical protein